MLTRLGDFLNEDSAYYQAKREEAFQANKWFLPELILLAGKQIAEHMLREDILEAFAEKYKVPQENNPSKTIGVIMAGNIPFVGFHDLLCVFLSGLRQRIKLSSKDSILMRMVLDVAERIDPGIVEYIRFEDMLKGCDAYIATGTDNSARYFEFYFSKFPHLIRKNRTSIAILTGRETEEELEGLADDIQLYFGLGCRNVTKILVPKGYDFLPLLNALKKYDHFKDHDRYRNNYDYQLTIAILNKKHYMTNGSILLIEDENPFSPISQLHYAYYQEGGKIPEGLDRDKIQCIVGKGQVPYGSAQRPGITDFPDGVNTMSFLSSL